MALVAGQRLGPYEILDQVGAGGMGEVYRARDPRLGRDVAVKVLPEEVARDPERLQRFEREARAVAALSHPSILTVFDVGTHEGVPYVVTELLQGETLRELLSRRAPTQRQVLFFLSQAAHGLEAAHAKGIVHRDVKPENLFVTADGRVKLLDFGLAKQLDRLTSGSGEVTESSPTGAGQVLGTVAYMSPEQVRGLPVDHRTDLFSFGVVAYELLSGKHPFRRETTVGDADGDPGGDAFGAGGPRLVACRRRCRGIVQRCLAKGREERFRSAHDLALSLESVLSAPAGAASLDEVEIQSPYPGLASFTEKEAGLFFGREAEVAALWQRLQNRRLLAVIGPSGTGKTVVRARGGDPGATGRVECGVRDAGVAAGPRPRPGPDPGAGGRRRGDLRPAARGDGADRERGERAGRVRREAVAGPSRRGAPRRGPVRGALHAEPEGGAGAFRGPPRAARERRGRARGAVAAGRLPDPLLGARAAGTRVRVADPAARPDDGRPSAGARGAGEEAGLPVRGRGAGRGDGGVGGGGQGGACRCWRSRCRGCGRSGTGSGSSSRARRTRRSAVSRGRSRSTPRPPWTGSGPSDSPSCARSSGTWRRRRGRERWWSGRSCCRPSRRGRRPRRSCGG